MGSIAPGKCADIEKGDIPQAVINTMYIKENITEDSFLIPAPEGAKDGGTAAARVIDLLRELFYFSHGFCIAFRERMVDNAAYLADGFGNFLTGVFAVLPYGIAHIIR